MSNDKIDEKATILLSELKQRGIKIFALYDDDLGEAKLTEYSENFKNEVNERLKLNPLRKEKPWPDKIANSDFFGELYKLEDYDKEIAQKEIYNACVTFEYEKNIVGKYFNSEDGKRITCFQPEKYIGTIYLLGACMIVGLFVEDKYTIGSYLQKNY